MSKRCKRNKKSWKSDFESESRNKADDLNESNFCVQKGTFILLFLIYMMLNRHKIIICKIFYSFRNLNGEIMFFHDDFEQHPKLDVLDIRTYFPGQFIYIKCYFSFFEDMSKLNGFLIYNIYFWGCWNNRRKLLNSNW